MGVRNTSSKLFFQVYCVLSKPSSVVLEEVRRFVPTWPPISTAAPTFIASIFWQFEKCNSHKRWSMFPYLLNGITARDKGNIMGRRNFCHDLPPEPWQIGRQPVTFQPSSCYFSALVVVEDIEGGIRRHCFSRLAKKSVCLASVIYFTISPIKTKICGKIFQKVSKSLSLRLAFRVNKAEFNCQIERYRNSPKWRRCR